MKSPTFFSGPPADVEPATILIVDDSPNQLLAMEALLDSPGQRVVTAPSGEEALRLLLELDCAVVLLDVHLPDIDGFEVARFMRKRERTLRTPIIFLSGLTADAHFTEQGYALGAVDFLFKPFQPRVLRAKVEVFVELYLQRVQLQRKAEREKAESERLRLLSMLTQTPTAIAIIRGPEFLFEFANPLFEQVVGRPMPLGRPLREVLPELGTQTRVMETLRQAMRTGEPFVGKEFSILLDRQGTGVLEESFFDCVHQPMRDESGEVVWLLLHAVEVTEQVRARRRLEAAEAALRQSAAESRSLAENIPDLVARFDRQHRYTYVNRVLDETGRSSAQFLGKTNEELGLPPVPTRLWKEAIDRVFLGEAFAFDFEFPSAHGSRYLHAHLVPERQENGEVCSVLAVTHDVTESRRREQALRESESRLRLMAEAGEVLSSLDERIIPGRLAALVVPRLADQASVELLSEAGALERVAMAHRDTEGVVPPLASLVPEGVTQVLRTGLPFHQVQAPEGAPAGVEGVLVLPLLAHGRVLGVLALVQAGSGRRFRDEDVLLAQELARRAGLAVDNARLYRVARGRADHMRLLADAFRAFTEAVGEMGPSLRAVVELVSESFGDACSLVLQDPDTGKLELAAAHHPDPSALALLLQVVGDLHQRSDGLVPTVMSSGKPLRLANIPQAPLADSVMPHARPFVERIGMHAILIVPLRAPEGIIGVLGVSRSRPHFPYTLEDQNLLQELADRAGLVVSNARLLDRLK